MCSIMGITGDCDIRRFRAGFLRTKSRGPDDSKIINTGKGLLGFHRLAIMGLTPEGMQPFEMNGSAIVCNGEIYGFEPIKKRRRKIIPSSRGRTARSSSPFGLKRAWRCFGSSTRSSR